MLSFDNSMLLLGSVVLITVDEFVPAHGIFAVCSQRSRQTEPAGSPLVRYFDHPLLSVRGKIS
jgi:hypothetical protein